MDRTEQREERLPFVAKETVEYLEKQFSAQMLLHAIKEMEAGESVGYMKGAYAVITRLKLLVQRQEETLSRH